MLLPQGERFTRGSSNQSSPRLQVGQARLVGCFNFRRLLLTNGLEDLAIIKIICVFDQTSIEAGQVVTVCQLHDVTSPALCWRRRRTWLPLT